jgi:hypothetical protein
VSADTLSSAGFANLTQLLVQLINYQSMEYADVNVVCWNTRATATPAPLILQ